MSGAPTPAATEATSIPAATADLADFKTITQCIKRYAKTRPLAQSFS